MRVLIASDGTVAAGAALAAAQSVPWPRGTRVRGVVALGRVRPGMAAATVRTLHARAQEVRDALKSRWPRAQVFELHDEPGDAIVAEARRFRADIVVLGWRGHGALARLVAGSVSRTVVERARCSVLVVRRAPDAPMRRLAVGFDSSPNARSAIRFIARLAAPRAGCVALIHVAQATAPDALTLAEQQAAIRALRARGWHAHAVVREGAPVEQLLAGARASGAQLIAVGAAARAGIDRLVLGSVAIGILNRSRLPVLIARRRALTGA